MSEDSTNHARMFRFHMQKMNFDPYFTLSVQFSRSVVSDSLRPHESQHARPPCPSPTPNSNLKIQNNLSGNDLVVFKTLIHTLITQHCLFTSRYLPKRIKGNIPIKTYMAIYSCVICNCPK